MPICTHCGEKNPDDAYRCQKCGVAFGHQTRAKADAQRLKIWSVVRIIGWVAIAIVVICVARPAYHGAFAAYYRYRLNTVKEAAMKSCGGPITENTPSSTKDQIDHCMATDELLIKAQGDYSDYTKGDK
jgi:uncharacterized membrane protein YvbJ